MTLFHAYVLAILTALALSFVNMREGDNRLFMMTLVYGIVIVGFHAIFYDQFTKLGLNWYLYVAGAQWGIGFMASEIRCHAARIIRPLAYLAVFLNLGTWVMSAKYDHITYWYAMNIIQISQVAALLMASKVWGKLGTIIRVWRAPDPPHQQRTMIGERHESTG